MWELLFKAVNKVKWMVFKRMEKTIVNKLQVKFSAIHASLELDEKELQLLMNDYAMGGTTKMKDIDAVLKKMKSRLRDVREMAIEYKNMKKDQEDAA